MHQLLDTKERKWLSVVSHLANVNAMKTSHMNWGKNQDFHEELLLWGEIMQLILCFFCLSLHHLQWRCHLIQLVKCGTTEGWFFKHLLPNSCVAGHTPLSTQQVLSEPDRLKNKQTSKSSTSYVMCVCVHTCVPLFLWPLPDVHLFDILHKRTSGERCERTHGHRVSVSHCFCWLNLHPSEGEVLGTRAYKAAICKISLRTLQLCNSLNLCVKNKITPSQRLL